LGRKQLSFLVTWGHFASLVLVQYGKDMELDKLSQAVGLSTSTSSIEVQEERSEDSKESSLSENSCEAEEASLYFSSAALTKTT
jgi:hypothetical protein